MKHLVALSKVHAPAPASDVQFCFWGVVPGVKGAFGKQVSNELNPGPLVVSGIEIPLDYYCKPLGAY